MRKRSFSIHFLTFYFLFFSTGWIEISAQQPELNATVSSQQVVQNTVFQIEFELKNASGENFQPPDFEPFRIVGGPAMGSSTVIINGEVTRSQSWAYSLLATKSGKFTIGPAQAIAGRKKISSKPIVVNVVAAEDMASSGSLSPGQEPIKLIAYVKPGDYYPGQQIVLEYKLLSRENIQSVNTISEDDYTDFFVQNFNSFSQEATYEDINGVRFASRIIRALALFPHQSGRYTIDPMVAVVGVNAPYPGNQGFFTMRRLHNIQVVSEPLTLAILPLPADPAPANSSGAVGEYELTTLPVSSTSITTDDDFILRIQIKGNGDSRRWDPPDVVTDGSFEMYDPRILEDKMMDENGSIVHSRVIEYVMIPQQPGDFNLHVPFRFFNPSTRQYETISSETIHLNVRQGRNMPRHAALDSTSNPVAMPVKPVRNIKTDDRFWLSIPHLFLFSILMVGTGYGLWVSYKRKREAEVPADERRRSAAARNARKQLELIRGPHEIPDAQFNERITEIYYKFLSEKFNIQPADLDAEKINQHFLRSGISDSVSQQAVQFYNECLSLRYGGVFAGYTREQLIHKCREIVDQLDSAGSIE